ncbi:MAG: 5,10-methylenetetrahydrofolate reductase [Elusimicrobia bacterium]|nr:5,10-methylenetetrahydrofolate reductase [Elusimicrobiota bacterium]
MIGTKQKTYEEIKHLLKNSKKIAILGCGDCATSCQTGGEQQVKELAEKLSKDGKTISHQGVIDVACDKRLVKKHLRTYKEGIDKADTLLVMACGSGVQTLAEAVEKDVLPALDSTFIGQIENLSKFYERCSVCGECILADTAGICVVTRCAKGLVNGPCGGSDQGKCEVNRDNDCAWYLVYERLKKLNKLENLKRARSPKSFSHSRKPRKIEIQRT